MLYMYRITYDRNLLRQFKKNANKQSFYCCMKSQIIMLRLTFQDKTKKDKLREFSTSDRTFDVKLVIDRFSNEFND